MEKERTMVSINSDGISGIVVTDNGQVLGGVRSATVWIEANEVTRIDLNLIGSRLNIRGQVQEVDIQCPFCDMHEIHQCPI